MHERYQKNRETAVEDMAEYLPVQRAMQFECAAASQAIELLRYLPRGHREIILLLADGANPLEISDETGKSLSSVLAIIKEARLWLSDGGMYLYRLEKE